MFRCSSKGSQRGQRGLEISSNQPLSQNAGFLSIHPDCHVSTAKLFQHPQLKPQAPELDTRLFDMRHTINDFETLVLQDYPEIRSAHHWLSQFAPAHLTGTGACVFSVFSSQQAAKKNCQKSTRLMAIILCSRLQ